MLKSTKGKVQERVYFYTWSSTAESNQQVAVRDFYIFFKLSALLGMEFVKILGSLTSVLLLATVNLAGSCLEICLFSMSSLHRDNCCSVSSNLFKTSASHFFAVTFFCRMQVMGRNPSLLQKRRMKKISK